MSAYFNTTLASVLLLLCSAITIVAIWLLVFNRKLLVGLSVLEKVSIVVCVAWFVYQAVIYFNKFLDSLPAFL